MHARVLSHANLLAGSEAVGLAWRWSAADRLVLALPLFHVHGLCVGLHGTLLACASAVLLPRFDVDAVFDAAGEHECSLFFGVPTMYHRFARSSRVGELDRLRLCVSGSAALPAELQRDLAELGGQQVLERYGMTETLMNVSNPYDGERRARSIKNKFSTTGRLLKLREYELATIDLRRLLGRRVDEILPTFSQSAFSYVIDCQRSDDGEIHAQMVELEPPTPHS